MDHFLSKGQTDRIRILLTADIVQLHIVAERLRKMLPGAQKKKGEPQPARFMQGELLHQQIKRRVTAQNVERQYRRFRVENFT